MQNKKRRKTHKVKSIIIAIAIIITLIVVISIIIIKNQYKPTGNVSILDGVYCYNENVRYEFNGKGKGAMYDTGKKYEYNYDINNEKLYITFKSKSLHDATYKYTLEDDSLTLIGKEGTTGGIYILSKEK